MAITVKSTRIRESFTNTDSNLQHKISLACIDLLFKLVWQYLSYPRPVWQQPLSYRWSPRCNPYKSPTFNQTLVVTPSGVYNASCTTDAFIRWLPCMLLQLCLKKIEMASRLVIIKKEQFDLWSWLQR